MNYTLVTNNERHFSRVPGLQIENWSIDEREKEGHEEEE
jgi:predicted nucleic acid-binding protein